MAINKQILFSIGLGGSNETVQKLHLLEVELDKITKQLRAAKAAGNPFEDLRAKQVGLRAEISKTSGVLRTQIGDWKKLTTESRAAKDSVVGMTQAAGKLQVTLDNMGKSARNTKVGQAMEKELRTLRAEINRTNLAVNNFKTNIGNYKSAGSGFLSGISGGLSGAGAMGLGVAAGAAALAAGKKFIAINTEIDKQQGAIAKTTGLNAASVEELTTSLKGLDSVTSTMDLLKIAEEAGRFGVKGAEGVEQFTKAVNLLSLGLGDEFSGGVEEITTVVAQLSNVIYGATTNGELMADRFQKIGNVLNGLANSGSATAGQIAEVATRMGGVSKALGFTEAEILGISSGIVEAGINVERGSTAFTRVNAIIRTNSAQTAKFLGITKEAFEELLDTKPVEAFQKVVSRVTEISGGSGTKVSQILKDLHINSQAAQELFLKWGQQQQLFNKRIGESESLITSTNTLLRDQATLTDTVAGAWTRFGNAVADTATSSGAQTFLKNMGNDLTDVINLLNGHKATALRLFLFGDHSVMSGFGSFGKTESLKKAVEEAKLDLERQRRGLSRDAINNPLLNRGSFGQGGGSGVSSNPYSNAFRDYTPSLLGNIQESAAERAARKAAADAAAKEIMDTDYQGGFPKGKGLKQEIPIVAGSLRDLQKQLADLNTSIQNTNPSSPLMESMQLRATALEKTIKRITDYIEWLGDPKKFDVKKIAADVLNKDTFGGATTIGAAYRANQAAEAKDSFAGKLTDLNKGRSATGDSPLSDFAIDLLQKEAMGLDPEDAWMKASDARAKIREEAFKKEQAKKKGQSKKDKNQSIFAFDDEELNQARDAVLDGIGMIGDAVFEAEQAQRDRRLQAELDAVDREYKAKYDAAAGNATLQEAILKQQEEKRLQIQKAAFEKEKKAKIQQAIINGALAVTAALTSAPPAGYILAAATAITTAIQVATIRNAKFAKGGFTGKGMGERDETGHVVAGVVHAKEYVLNPDQVQEYRPLVNMFEENRLKKMRGFAEGGFTSIPQLVNPNRSGGSVAFTDNQMQVMAQVIASTMGSVVYRAVKEGSEQGTKKGAYYGATEGNRTREREDSLRKTTEY